MVITLSTAVDDVFIMSYINTNFLTKKIVKQGFYLVCVWSVLQMIENAFNDWALEPKSIWQTAKWVTGVIRATDKSLHVNVATYLRAFHSPCALELIAQHVCRAYITVWSLGLAASSLFIGSTNKI